MYQLMLNTTKILGIMGLSICALAMTGCQRQPPSERPAVTLPVYPQGDVDNGKAEYDKACLKCHKLQPGNNEKGPQLMRIYGAKSALLTDYQYTDAMKNSNMVWTAENLDKYIAQPKQTVVGTRMRSEPIADANVRQDIIAYLATLH